MNNDRRNFLKQSSILGGALLLPSLPSLATTNTSIKPGFKLTIMATDWGFTGGITAFCAAAKQAGYDGIEVWWSGNPDVQTELFKALKDNDLAVGYLAAGSNSNFDKHFSEFETNLQRATAKAAVKPLYVNCHSGRDYFTFEQNCRLIDMTTRISRASGIPVYHETHRSRMLFAAHIAKQFIDAKPDLRLTLDISHWCNVHESLLQDQPEAVAAALSRASHFHARVGHQEGPQVSDPRAPEWEAAVKQHFSWWDQIVQRHQAEGKPLTVLTEFGPPNYMPTLPYTRQPLANQWDINVYMMQQLRARYAAAK